MTPVQWTAQARDDLAAVHEFISRESPHYADLVVRRLIEPVARLPDSLESGRIVSELHDPGIREVLWQSYRLVYRHRPGAQQVMAVAAAL